jgi:hypothetical protein
MTSETPLRLRASPSAPTRKDVHERNQGDDHDRSDSDDGNRGCGDDHARIVSGNLFVKTLSGEWYGSRSTESGGKRREHAEVSVKSPIPLGQGFWPSVKSWNPPPTRRILFCGVARRAARGTPTKPTTAKPVAMRLRRFARPS